MVNLLENGYLVFTGNVVFDFVFSWVGFFALVGWSFGMIYKILSKFK